MVKCCLSFQSPTRSSKRSSTSACLPARDCWKMADLSTKETSKEFFRPHSDERHQRQWWVYQLNVFIWSATLPTSAQVACWIFFLIFLTCTSVVYILIIKLSLRIVQFYVKERYFWKKYVLALSNLKWRAGNRSDSMVVLLRAALMVSNLTRLQVCPLTVTSLTETFCLQWQFLSQNLDLLILKIAG